MDLIGLVSTKTCAVSLFRQCHLRVVNMKIDIALLLFLVTMFSFPKLKYQAHFKLFDTFHNISHFSQYQD